MFSTVMGFQTNTKSLISFLCVFQVQFSPVVQVHVMRTWPFARRACRKGHWEEMARDRDRFRRRIGEAEQTVGRCFTPAHRRTVWAYLRQTTAPER